MHTAVFWPLFYNSVPANLNCNLYGSFVAKIERMHVLHKFLFNAQLYYSPVQHEVQLWHKDILLYDERFVWYTSSRTPCRIASEMVSKPVTLFYDMQFVK